MKKIMIITIIGTMLLLSGCVDNPTTPTPTIFTGPYITNQGWWLDNITPNATGYFVVYNHTWEVVGGNNSGLFRQQVTMWYPKDAVIIDTFDNPPKQESWISLNGTVYWGKTYQN